MITNKAYFSDITVKKKHLSKKSVTHKMTRKPADIEITSLLVPLCIGYESVPIQLAAVVPGLTIFSAKI